VKCAECFSKEGTYHEVEDFNPGADEFGQPEWSYYEYWQCMRCDNVVYSYEDNFKYEDEE